MHGARTHGGDHAVADRLVHHIAAHLEGDLGLAGVIGQVDDILAAGLLALPLPTSSSSSSLRPTSACREREPSTSASLARW